MRSQHWHAPIPPEKDRVRSLAELEANLEVSTAHFNEMRAASAAANRAEMNARNELNDAQKQLDARIAELRKAAPAGDWADRGLGARVPE